MKANNTRREFLRASALIGSALILTNCGGKSASSGPSDNQASSKDEEKGGEVTATEDLMREHGVLRRALLVYTATAAKLRGQAAGVVPDALQQTAKLFRDFGEDYHEKKLEEAY